MNHPRVPVLSGLLLAALAWGLGCAVADGDETSPRPAASYDGPIIDTHLHAFAWDEYGSPPPPNEITGKIPEAGDDAAVIALTLAELERLGIVRAVVSGSAEMVARWRAAAPDVLVPGLVTQGRHPLPPVEELRGAIERGEIQVLGELGLQYVGKSATDEDLEPYFALAEEKGIPVGLHTGLGPPGSPYGCCPKFRTGLGDPARIEELLVRHPRLKIYLMHAGWPWLESTKAILYMYPQVHVDISVLDWALPRAEFHGYLQALVDAGFEDRILFGSDQMIWTDAIALAIEGVDAAPFLTLAQKRKIFHDNAVRFFGLAASGGGAS